MEKYCTFLSTDILRLRTESYGLDDQGYDFRQGLGIFPFTTVSGAYSASYSMGTRGSFAGSKAAGDVKLTTHLHLVPRSRMCGAIPPLNQDAFLAWC
jgi:hypothetical protein